MEQKPYTAKQAARMRSAGALVAVGSVLAAGTVFSETVEKGPPLRI